MHAVVAQPMCGGFPVDVHAPAAQLRGGAEIMYYGGDIAELLLAAALVATWWPRAAPRGSGRERAAGALTRPCLPQGRG